jgi:hypothetical protein
MTQLLQKSTGYASLSSSAKPLRFIDLLHAADERLLTLISITIALTWIPPALLTALHGGNTFVSFLTDYASQSRFLIILPVLILTAPNLHNRVARVAGHLEDFVQENQLSTFKASWVSFEKLRSSWIAQFVIVLSTYAFVVWLAQYVSPEGAEIVDWWKGDNGGFRWFSAAGMWVIFVSYPILGYFILLWLWRQFLWTRFMLATARLDLRLIAAHPDGLGGIGFVESAFRGQQPFCFCLGVGLAGAVANRMFHHGQKLTSFVEVAVFLVGSVLLVCVAPYFVFTPALMQMRRIGLLKYGGFARAAGEHFEKKWLDRPDSLHEDVLMVADFSAIHNLYGVVGNVNQVSVLPVSRVDLYSLLAVAFVPAIPVALGSVPFDVVAKAALKLLF